MSNIKESKVSSPAVDVPSDVVYYFLEAERKHRNMNKKDFAKLCGATPGTYNWWRLQALPSLNCIVTMAKNNIDLIGFLRA